MKEKNAEIAARIDEVICLLHTNPNKLANALGYSRAQTIYDILNGKSAPSYDFFRRFCESGYSVFINLRWLFTGKGNPLIEETYLQSDLPIIKGEMTAEDAEKKLKTIRSNHQVGEKEQSLEMPVSPMVEPLMGLIREKDKTIRDQAEEIGKLKARIEEIEGHRGADASDAGISGVAHAG